MRLMNSKLFVGNLSDSTTEIELHKLFLQAGIVNSVWLARDRMSGRSRGFAYVEMSNPGEAQKAIEILNGQNFGDRTLRVSLASLQDESAPAGTGRGAGTSRRHPRGDGNKSS
jgi:RNA recognition motif-containing protein